VRNKCPSNFNPNPNELNGGRFMLKILEGTVISHIFFNDGTIIKIPSEIRPPLFAVRSFKYLVSR
jgi:hypothetical protein